MKPQVESSPRDCPVPEEQIPGELPVEFPEKFPLFQVAWRKKRKRLQDINRRREAFFSWRFSSIF
jgi:hypothetical protein